MDTTNCVYRSIGLDGVYVFPNNGHPVRGKI